MDIEGSGRPERHDQGASVADLRSERSTEDTYLKEDISDCNRVAEGPYRPARHGEGAPVAAIGHQLSGMHCHGTSP